LYSSKIAIVKVRGKKEFSNPNIGQMTSEAVCRLMSAVLETDCPCCSLAPAALTYAKPRYTTEF
jgi:hypothetical protein